MRRQLFSAPQNEYMEVVREFERQLSTTSSLPIQPKLKSGKMRKPRVVILSDAWREHLLLSPHLYDKLGVHLRSIPDYRQFVVQPLLRSLP